MSGEQEGAARAASAERRALIRRLIAEELAGEPAERHDPALGHPLVVSPLGAEEVGAAVEVLLSTRVTMGAETRAFEAEWAAYCGRAGAVMVNSGSSANLLMLGALVACGRLAPGDEVLVPAVTWSTSLFPVIQAGLVPVMVDVHPETLCIDPASAARARGARTRAVLAVHLLGQMAETGAFDGLMVLEDACGAHGGRYGGRIAGSIGEMAAFSFFFSHHITTMEGGIVVADDPELLDMMRSMRAHGWARERSDRAALEAATPEIDARFLFVSSGYNLRPTDVQAALGRAQLRRLPEWVRRRRENHRAWCAQIGGLSAGESGRLQVFPEAPGTEHAGFAFPILAGGPRGPLMRRLEAAGVETRPVSGSNLVRQPAFRQILARGQARLPVELPVSDAIHERGLFIGNSHAFGAAHGARIAEIIGQIAAGQNQGGER